MRRTFLRRAGSVCLHLPRYIQALVNCIDNIAAPDIGPRCGLFHPLDVLVMGIILSSITTCERGRKCALFILTDNLHKTNLRMKTPLRVTSGEGKDPSDRPLLSNKRFRPAKGSRGAERVIERGAFNESFHKLIGTRPFPLSLRQQPMPL